MSIYIYTYRHTRHSVRKSILLWKKTTSKKSWSRKKNKNSPSPFKTRNFGKFPWRTKKHSPRPYAKRWNITVDHLGSGSSAINEAPKGGFETMLEDLDVPLEMNGSMVVRSMGYVINDPYKWDILGAHKTH